MVFSARLLAPRAKNYVFSGSPSRYTASGRPDHGPPVLSEIGTFEAYCLKCPLIHYEKKQFFS